MNPHCRGRRSKRSHVSFDELGTGRHRVGISGGEVVDDDNLVSTLEQHSAAHTADVTGAAGDQEFHLLPQTCLT